MAAGADRAARAARAREAGKARRQKIFIGIGGGLLLGLVAFQLPLFGSSSGPGHRTAPTSVAVPVSSASKVSGSPTRQSSRHAAGRDVFAPLVAAVGTGLSARASEGRTLKGPTVRATHFVSKDFFIPQVKPPAATPASSPVSGSDGSGSDNPSPGASGGGGYIVVLASIPGINTASQKAAARAVVAAKNAGLKDVVANDAVPGTSGSAPHFTVYTGPYEFESTAQTELVRALRNGYPGARAQQLPGSSGKGF
jgi:hypothetical protein